MDIEFIINADGTITDDATDIATALTAIATAISA